MGEYLYPSGTINKKLKHLLINIKIFSANCRFETWQTTFELRKLANKA